MEEKTKEVSSKGVPAQPALAEADALASLASQDPLPAEGRVSAVAIDQEAKDSAVQENTRAVMMLMRKIDGFLDCLLGHLSGITHTVTSTGGSSYSWSRSRRFLRGSTLVTLSAASSTALKKCPLSLVYACKTCIQCLLRCL